MGDHAQGDFKKVIWSSDEEELQQEVYRGSPLFPPVTIMISQLNYSNKRVPSPGTSGEAPAVPTPPITNDSDCQFWAEDEMSSSESRLRLVCKRRRRHSLAYRNRAAVRKRSRSLLCQSSSSNSDPAIELAIVSPMRCNARRRLRCNHRQGPSATKRSRAGHNHSVLRASTPRPPLNFEIPNPLSAVNNSMQSGTQNQNSSGRLQRSHLKPARRRSGNRSINQPQSLTCNCNEILPNNVSASVDKCKNQNTRPPSTSKRK